MRESRRMMRHCRRRFWLWVCDDCVLPLVWFGETTNVAGAGLDNRFHRKLLQRKRVADQTVGVVVARHRSVQVRAQLFTMSDWVLRGGAAGARRLLAKAPEDRARRPGTVPARWTGTRGNRCPVEKSKRTQAWMNGQRGMSRSQCGVTIQLSAAQRCSFVAPGTPFPHSAQSPAHDVSF